MNETVDRRTTLKTLAVGGAALAVGGSLPVLAQASAPLKVTDLAGSLPEEWAVAEFEFDGSPALLVRVPAPAAGNRSGRALAATRKGKDGKDETIHLVAYALVCTHLGCKPGLPEGTKRELTCPCHGSMYRGEDGGVIKGPARADLGGIKLEVRQGAVFAVGAL